MSSRRRPEDKPRGAREGVTGLALLLSVACVAGSAGCSKKSAPALHSGQASGFNVLLITIDTLRRDRVGAYSDRKDLTPTLDSLAHDGIRYRHAYSHVPMTLPAHTSILTGLLPRKHGVHTNTGYRLGDDVPTMATELKGRGYRTGAFVGSFVLDARFGLARGFDEYDDRLPHREGASFHFSERRAADVVARAGDWILGAPATNHQPWFAWVHLYDPHAPYDAPEEFRAGRSPYDAEVAYADAMLGRLLERLRGARQLDRTLIVMTADHGESLGEHGETTHGLFAYDATVAVPLIVSCPSVIGRGIVDRTVAHVDIMPTVMDLVGAPLPAGLDGRSLTGPLAADRPVYIEALDAALTRDWAPLRGVVEADWKYIDLPEPELYDLSSDPLEQHNRAGHEPQDQALRRMLSELTDSPEARAPAARIDSEAESRLRSLGYTGGLVRPVDAPGHQAREADDPKRLVGLNERFNTALTDFDSGRVEGALAEFERILRERPDFLSARTSAATALLSEGRASEAVRLLRDAPAGEQASADLLVRLGDALRESGDLRGAATAFQQAKNAGWQTDVDEDLAVTYAALGRLEEARELFRQLLARQPHSAPTWYNLGLLEMQAGRAGEAAADFRQAVDREPSYGDAWRGLGAALVGTDRAAAISAWRKAEQLLPQDYDLLFNLGVVLSESRTPKDAVPYLSRFVHEAPQPRYRNDVEKVRGMIARLER